MSSRAASTSAGRKFNLSLDPDTARKVHDETLPKDGHKGGAFLLDVQAEVLF